MHRSECQGGEDEQEKDTDENNPVDPAGLPVVGFHVFLPLGFNILRLEDRYDRDISLSAKLGLKFKKDRWKKEDRFAKMRDDRMNRPFSP